jgi:hypothetical protein
MKDEKPDAEVLAFAEALVTEVFGKQILPVLNRALDVVEKSVHSTEALGDRLARLEAVLDPVIVGNLASSANLSRELEQRMAVFQFQVAKSWKKIMEPALDDLVANLKTSITAHALERVKTDLSPSIARIRDAAAELVRAGITAAGGAIIDQESS